MDEPTAKSFGSASFQSRMASIYRAQARLLDELIEWSFQESTRHVLPFFGAIRGNCESMVVLQESGLLNDFTLVNRVFVQRIINCCYLLNAEKETIEDYLSNQAFDKETKIEGDGADEFIKLSSTYRPKAPESILKVDLFDQIVDISEKTGIPKDSFLVILASIFPKSSEILAGSLFGNTFQYGLFQKDHAATAAKNGHIYLSEELSASLFLNIGILDIFYQVISKREPINAIREKSSEYMTIAKALVEGNSSGAFSLTSHADGAWHRLVFLEYSAQKALLPQLQPYDESFQDTYEAGLLAPILRKKEKNNIDPRLAALFLKRALNDLRGVWILLSKGYTSQAASIAASLYESSLATICLLQSSENIEALLADPHREIPWSITEMAKMVVRSEGRTAGPEFENAWRALYAHYVWLCQIKHSTPDSVAHDTVASSMEGKGYAVMALPNVREEDLSTKAMVAFIAISRCIECIETFAMHSDSDVSSTDFGFKEKLTRARNSSWNAFQLLGKNGSPITIARSRFTKKYPPASS